MDEFCFVVARWATEKVLRESKGLSIVLLDSLRLFHSNNRHDTYHILIKYDINLIHSGSTCWSRWKESEHVTVGKCCYVCTLQVRTSNLSDVI